VTKTDRIVDFGDNAIYFTISQHRSAFGDFRFVRLSRHRFTIV